MRVRFKWSSLRQCRWNEYLIRFFFGGLITALAGVIADQVGPAVGGLFLAFPAIFPASVTLIESQERRKKRKRGRSGADRGKNAAAVESAGTALGALGLIAFAVVVWKEIERHPSLLTILLATLVWFVISLSLWWCRKHYRLSGISRLSGHAHLARQKF